MKNNMKRIAVLFVLITALVFNVNYVNAQTLPMDEDIVIDTDTHEVKDNQIIAKQNTEREEEKQSEAKVEAKSEEIVKAQDTVTSTKTEEVVKNEAANAPNVTKAETREVTRDGETEEPEEEQAVIRIHIMHNRNATQTYEELSVIEIEPGKSKTQIDLNASKLFNLSVTNTTIDGVTVGVIKSHDDNYFYTLEGWYLDENNQNKLTNTTGLPTPVENYNDGLSRLSINSATSGVYTKALYITTKNITISKDYYLYSNWTRSNIGTVSINIYETQINTRTEEVTTTKTDKVLTTKATDNTTAKLPLVDAFGRTDGYEDENNTYTFLGWYDENGVLLDSNYVISGDYSVLSTLKYGTASSTKWRLEAQAIRTLTEDATLNVYGKWNVTPIAKGTVTIKYYDLRSGQAVDTNYTSTTKATDTQSYPVSARSVFPDMNTSYQVSDDDYIYTFDGWYALVDGEYQNIQDPYTPIGDYSVLRQLYASGIHSSNPNLSYRVYARAAANQYDDVTLNLYAKWTQTAIPKGKVTLYVYDTRGENPTYTNVSEEAQTNANQTQNIDLSSVFSLDSNFQTRDDDYIYTFAGWYDAPENGTLITDSYDPSTVYPTLKTLTSRDANDRFAYRLSFAAADDLYENDEVNVYAYWTQTAIPKGTVTVHFYDTITNANVDTGVELVAKTNAQASNKTLNAVFSSLQDGPTRSYGGKKYNFLGWYDETGALISSDYDPSTVYPSLKSLYTAASEDPTRYFLYAEAVDDLFETPEINVYAKWEVVAEEHHITVELYDVKPGKDPVLVHTNNDCKVTPNGACTAGDPLDEIFDEDKSFERGYSGVNNEYVNTETDSNHIYTFLGWYDAPENGNLIDENYELSGDLAILTAINARYGGETEEGTPIPYDISWTRTGTLDDDYKLKLYGYWSSYKTPRMSIKRINEVTLEYNSSWENSNGTTTSITKQLPTPKNKAGHEFMYWKVYKQILDEETGEVIEEVPYDDKTYIDTPFVYTFDLSPENEDGYEQLVARAFWQSSVTLNVYKEYKKSMPSTYIIYHEESTIAVGNKVTLAEEPSGYNYTKQGYEFAGYYMMVDGEEVAVSVGTEFTAPPASYENVDPIEYQVWATWTRIEETVTVSKVWDDELNNGAHRPDSVTLELYAIPENAEEGTEPTLAYTVDLSLEDEETTVEGNTWSKELSGFYPYDEKGNRLIYTVVEKEHVLSYNSEQNIDEDNKQYTLTNTVMDNGTVYVKYIDVETGAELVTVEPIVDSIEQPYKTEQLEIPKYVFYGMAEDSAPAAGAITAEAQTVIYLYERTFGYIRVHHVDVKGDYISRDKDYETCENGCQVEYRQIIEGTLGEPYTATSLTIYGYKNIAEDGTDFNGGDNEEIGIFHKQGVFTKEGFDIFFVYVEATGKVTVYYVDEEGNLIDKVEATGKVADETFTTELKDFENYTLDEEQEVQTVTYTEEDQIITYTYTKNLGLVIVHYVDKDTNKDIETARIIDKKVDEAYTTQQISIPDYHYVDKSNNTVGVVTAEQTDVYYYYEKDNGTVIVHHIGIKAETEKELDSESLSGKIGSDYTTSSKEFEHYTLDGNRLPEAGKFVSGSINVYYYYTWNKGQVVVHYVADDQETELDTVTLDPANVDAKYETKAKEFTSYRLTGDSGNRNGIVTEGQTDVYYYYTRLESDVTVHYVDADTNEELDTEYGHGKVGETYTLINKDFENYTLVSRPEGETVTYTEEPIELTYTYKKNSGSITVYYKDLFTGKEIEGVEVKNTSGYVDQKYNAEPIDIEGYKFIRTEGNEELVGNYPNGENYVFTHYYQKVGKVVTHYYEIDSTTKVAEDVEQSGPINEIYMTTPAEDVEGYSLVETPENASGRYSEELTEVIYYYQKLGKVITHYLDNNGNVLANSTESTGVVGEGYTTTPAKVEDYEVTGTPDNATGEYTKEDINVTYIYTKVTEPEKEYGNVHVKHITLDGTLLEEKTITLVVGEAYETKELDTEEYELVSVSGDQTGTIEVGTKEVLYVYKEKEEEPSEPSEPEQPKPGRVVVLYTDTEGYELLKPVEIPGNVGDEYITSQPKIDGYKIYEVKGEKRGEIVAGTTYVEYVYEKVEEPSEPTTPDKEEGTVIAYYIDENGNSIADPMIIPGTYGTTYITYQKVIPGYTGTSIPENRIGKIEQELLELYYEYAKNEETPSEEPGSSCEGNCNCCNTCNTCNCNNGESQQPQIIININNENNSDNHSENNSENHNDNSSDNHSENNNDNNVNNEVNNDTNVENNTDVNNENNNQDETNVNIENNPVNNNESSASAENGDTNVTTGDVTTGDTNVTTGDTNTNVTTGDQTVSTGDTNVDVTTGDTTIENNPTVENNTNVETGDVTTGDTNIENNPVVDVNNQNENNPTNNVENNTNVENNPTNNVENNTDVDASSNNTNDNNSNSESNNNIENNSSSESNPNVENTNTSESNPVINLDNSSSSESNPTVENNPTNTVNVEVNPTIENNPTNENNNESNPVNNNDGSNTNTNENTNNNDNTCENCKDPEKQDDPSVQPSQPEQSDKKETGRVLVKYVDEEGYTISPMVTIEGKEGTDYSTDKLRIQGYEFDNVAGEPEGNITNGTTYVTYTYKTVPATVAGKVIVHYQDTEGKTLADDELIEGNVGDDYASIEKYIEGYELTEITKVEPQPKRLMLRRAVINEENGKGQIKEGTTEITYIYEEVKAPVVEEKPQGTVIVRYIDEDGYALTPSLKFEGEEGTEYSTDKLKFDNYEFDSLEGEPAGQITDKTTYVIYKYKSLPKEEEKECCTPTVIVNCNICPEQQCPEQQCPTQECPEQQCPDKECPTPEEPVVKPEVKYGTVITYYYDTEGNELLAKKEKTYEVGENYTTIKESISNYKYKTVIGSANGSVKEGTTEVIYIYEKVVPSKEDTPKENPSKGSVVVYYKDTKGNKIAGNVTLKGTIGTAFTTFAKDIDNYKLVKVIGNREGNYTQTLQQVTYIYEKLADNGEVLGENEEFNGTGRILPPNTKVDFNYLNLVPFYLIMLLLTSLYIKKES